MTKEQAFITMEEIVYVLYDKEQNIHRIGKSSNLNLSRIKTQISSYPNKLLYFVFYTTNCTKLETNVLRYLKASKINGSWFNSNIAETLRFLASDNTISKMDFPSPRTLLL